MGPSEAFLLVWKECGNEGRTIGVGAKMRDVALVGAVIGAGRWRTLARYVEVKSGVSTHNCIFSSMDLNSSSSPSGSNASSACHA